MPITDHYERRALDSLYVNRETRQRRNVSSPDGAFLNADGLRDSIKQRGVLTPILVTRDGEIVFGERRWTASRDLGLPDIPVRYVEDLSPTELKVIELEENLRRTDLPWRDQVRATAELHAAYEAQRAAQPGSKPWTQRETAQATNIPEGSIQMLLRIAQDIDSPRIANATGFRQAYNTLARLDERASADVLESIIHGASSIVGGAVNAVRNAATALTGVGTDGGTAENERTSISSGPDPLPSVPERPITAESVLCADFLTWAPTHTGPRFNLIHCDFPYGIEVFSGPNMKRGHTGTTGSYDDRPERYWELIECLCTHRDRLMAHSAHLMFWLSADHEIVAETLKRFRALAPDLVWWPKPLIWHKTDNAGVLGDPKRKPRHVYEMALVAAREDRLLVKGTGDAYGAPTDHKLHPSCKPEPVLRHFLSMFVDETTSLLDPTCGSASALRAAESLGAQSVLGLELDPEHARTANGAMRAFRALRSTQL